jgi:hypothetical protein
MRQSVSTAIRHDSALARHGAFCYRRPYRGDKETRMKIPLNIDRNGPQSGREAQAKVIERDVLAARKGDWNAKNSLVRTFTPLLTQMARKRTAEPAKVNTFIEAGKGGLLKAVRAYRPGSGADHFQISAARAIETAMDKVDRKGGGFFSRLFGG